MAAFLGLSLLVILTPGPNQALLTTRTLQGGRPAGLATVAGLTAGMVLHVLAAVVGLSALLAASAELFAAAKLVGGALLVALGLAALLAARRALTPPGPEDARAGAVAPRRAVLEGAASMALNPKVTVFFVAVAPQFVAPGAGASLRVAALLLLYAALALAFWIAWVLAVDHAQALVRRPAVHAWLQRATGLALMAFGLRLALDGDGPGPA